MLRRQRYIGKQIAAEVGISPATVSRILRRLGLNRMYASRNARQKHQLPLNRLSRFWSAITLRFGARRKIEDPGLWFSLQ